MASEIRVNQIQSRTGVSTISFTETGPIISGVTTITGDLDVTGLVSYDDVTNIDSVGVVTARNGLNVTGGNVGIGTYNSGAKLEVHSDTIPRINTVFQGSKHFGMSVGGSGGGCVLTDGHFMTVNHQPYADRGTDNNLTERLRITSAGLVGIGTDNPNRLLQVDGASGGNGQVLISTNGAFSGTDTADLSFRVYANPSNGNAHNPQAQIQAVGTGSYDAALTFKTAVGGSDNNTPLERLRITSAGDVGIGINAPTTGNIASQAKFIHIHNSATTTHSPAEIYFTNANSGSSGGAGGLVTFYNTGFYFWNYANDDIVFGTGGNERFKFNHSTNTLDFTSTSKIRLQGGQNSGGTLAHINIGSDGGASSDTRAIDVWGNWQDQESKSITYNHGTGTSDMVCQQRVRYDQSPSRTNYEIGRFYHGQNTTAFPFQLQSTSTTTADLTIDGNVLHKTAAFVARSTSNHNIQSTTGQKIDYTVDYSYQSVFNNTNDRFTCTKTGLYFFYARHWFNQNTTGTVYMDFLKNGSLIKEFRTTHPTASSEFETVQGSAMIYMAANDYLEVNARSDGNGIFHESQGGVYSEFSGFYVSGG